jgi:tetratricopeptide (TPR) repeat protein
MTYIDTLTGQKKRWTQADLGQQLGISALMVRLMEKQGKGLEGMQRRQALVDILKIPPVLLGLTTIEQLTEFLTNGNAAGTLTKKPGVSTEKLELYQDAYSVYSEKRDSGDVTRYIPSMEAWTSRIEKDTQSHVDQMELMAILWNFHMLLSRVYSYDNCEWGKASEHAKEASLIGGSLENSDLLAASAYRAGEIQISSRNWQVAYTDFQGVLQLTKGTNSHTRAAIYAYAALTIALTQKDEMSVKKAQDFLDLSEKCVLEMDDTSAINFDYSKYLTYRADALICLNRPIKALEYIKEAEDLTDPSSKRYISYLKILRAESYVKRKRPEYDNALFLIKEVLLSDSVEHHIRYIKRIFKIIQDSSYGNSPAATELRLILARK